MHERYVTSTRPYGRQTRTVKAITEARPSGLTAESTGYVLGFSLVFAAAAFVLAHHFVMH